MKDKIKDFFILLLACIAIVFIIKTCNKPVTNRSVTHSSDTTFITNIDTVVSYDTITKTKVKYYTNTVYLDTNAYHLYTDSIVNDTVKFKFKGIAKMMKESDLSYKLRIPTRTITKDSTITINNLTTIHDTITKKTIGYVLSGGVQSMVSPIRYDIGPMLQFGTPKGNIGYSYGVLNKTHQVFVTIPIIKQKK